MGKRMDHRQQQGGTKSVAVSLARYFNWPTAQVRGKWWRELAKHVAGYPRDWQTPWGIPFQMARGTPRVILAVKERDEVTIPLHGTASFLCFLHEWRQLPATVRPEDPSEGLVVAEYRLTYADGTSHVQPVRARFEVAMAESPGPAWLAVPFKMGKAVDPVEYSPGREWGHAQTGTTGPSGLPLVYAMPNPLPRKPLRALTIRGCQASPLLVAALTVYRGASHPLRHLPRRAYRVHVPGQRADIEHVDVDLGGVVRLERSVGARDNKWLSSPFAGIMRGKERGRKSGQIIRAFGAEDATLSVKFAGRRKRMKFSLGEAFHQGQAGDQTGEAKLQILDRHHQWMLVCIRDAVTGQPTPARVHFSGPRGEYVAPYGHHEQINTRWFMDYGADVVVGGKNFAYVPGEFTTDMPVGEVFVEVCKGYEYAPVRRKLTIRPGQKRLELRIDRSADWRRNGWITADTHVHFISPHTAALQAQGEGINLVNLLASQWGRLFTNVGDIRGRVNVVEDDTIVYVGTENRNHMLGHMSMLGTQGLPVYPMCCGGPTEAWLGDPDFVSMAQWARENRRKGGLVIRPHYPYCGHTEDPVPILAGLVDALEIMDLHEGSFPTQEWYRYLNCGYRVAVAGGTDKMGAYCALGWMRTYARIDPNRPFTYGNWAKAVRAGRTFSTTGPQIDMTVDGREIGETIRMTPSGGTVEVRASAECVWPLGRLEIVHNGHVVADRQVRGGAKALSLSAKVAVRQSGWIAARCCGQPRHPGGYVAAHTSPVYLKVGDTRAFDGPAAEHMLALVEGGIEYLNTLATAYDERSRKRMVKLFNEARQELKGRLLVESSYEHHPGKALYHTHGHARSADHAH